MSTTLTETLLSLYFGGIYFFMVLLTSYLGRKSNLHWSYVCFAAVVFTPIAGMVLLLWFGERMNSYQKVERLKQLRDQGILSEAEFNWKYRPATPEMMLRELAILRDEGVLSRSEYRSKVYKLMEQEEESYQHSNASTTRSSQSEMALS